MVSTCSLATAFIHSFIRKLFQEFWLDYRNYPRDPEQARYGPYHQGARILGTTMEIMDPITCKQIYITSYKYKWEKKNTGRYEADGKGPPQRLLNR